MSSDGLTLTGTLADGEVETFSRMGISSISPTSGPKHTIVDIHGTGLSQTTNVLFGSASAVSFNVLSDTDVLASTPAGSGSVPVILIGPFGQFTAPQSFTYSHAKPSTRYYVSPDIKVVQYIAPIDTSRCWHELTDQGFSDLQATGVCAFLSVSANPLPPTSFPDDPSWASFVDSEEYRSYVHLPPQIIRCDGGNVTAVDNIPVTVGANPGLGLPFPLDGLDTSLGYMPGRPFLPGYSDAEPFESNLAFDPPSTLFSKPFLSVRSDGSVLVSYLSSSRMATAERAFAYPLTGYDAPYIWTVTQLRVDCVGHQNVSVANSEFPTTNLYVDGQLTDWDGQRDLGQFIKEGGSSFNASYSGFLALHPTCGTRIHWGSGSLRPQQSADCAGDIDQGPYGGVSGNNL